MPTYNFTCDKCDFVSSFAMSVDSFKQSKNGLNNIFCKNCGEKEELTRLFTPTFGKIWKGKHELMADIKEDVKKIVKKVRSGDQSAIREIYGEEN